MSSTRPGKATDDHLLLDQQLCFAVYSAGLAMNKFYRRALRSLEVTYPQYLVLLVLWETDRMRVTAIGERLFLDSATLTPLLKRLESAGLVERRRDPGDERSVIVSLTPAGKSLRLKARALPQALLRATACSVPEVRSLKLRLDQLRTHVMRSTPDGERA